MKIFERYSPVFGTVRKILRPVTNGKFACAIMQDGAERDLGIVDDIYINELLTAGYYEIWVT